MVSCSRTRRRNKKGTRNKRVSKKSKFSVVRAQGEGGQLPGLLVSWRHRTQSDVINQRVLSGSASAVTAGRPVWRAPFQMGVKPDDLDAGSTDGQRHAARPPSNAFSFSSGSASAFSLSSGSSSIFGARSTNLLHQPAAAVAPAEPSVDLDVRTVSNPKWKSLSVPASASVADVKALLELPAGQPGTLLYAGTCLTCPTERLCDLGIRGTAKIFFVDKHKPDTPPLGKSIAPPEALTAVALAAAASAAASSGAGTPGAPGTSGASSSSAAPLPTSSATAGEPVGATSSSSSSASAAEPPPKPIRVTKVNIRQLPVPPIFSTLDVWLVPSDGRPLSSSRSPALPGQRRQNARAL